MEVSYICNRADVQMGAMRWMAPAWHRPGVARARESHIATAVYGMQQYNVASMLAGEGRALARTCRREAHAQAAAPAAASALAGQSYCRVAIVRHSGRLGLVCPAARAAERSY